MFLTRRSFFDYDLFDYMFDDLNALFYSPAMTNKKRFNKTLPSISQNVEKNEVSIVFEVPGFGAEDLEVSYLDGVLNVNTKPNKDTNSKRQLKYSTTFYDIDENSIEAKCKDGILTIKAKTITKTEPQKKLIPVS